MDNKKRRIFPNDFFQLKLPLPMTYYDLLGISFDYRILHNFDDYKDKMGISFDIVEMAMYVFPFFSFGTELNLLYNLHNDLHYGLFDLVLTPKFGIPWLGYDGGYFLNGIIKIDLNLNQNIKMYFEPGFEIFIFRSLESKNFSSTLKLKYAGTFSFEHGYMSQIIFGISFLHNHNLYYN